MPAGYSGSGIPDTFLSCFRLSTGEKNLQNKPFVCPVPAAPDSESSRNLTPRGTLHPISSFSYLSLRPLDNTW